MGLIRWSWKLFWAGLFAASLLFNVAAFTVSGMAAAVNGAYAAIGMTTVAARTAARAATRLAAAAPARAAARGAAARVSTRVARGAARSAGSVVAQSVPWIGAAAVVGITAWEISDACAMLDDLQALETALDALEPDAAGGAGGASPARKGAETAEERERVCGMQVPTVDEVRDGIRAAPWEAVNEARRWLAMEPDERPAPDAAPDAAHVPDAAPDASGGRRAAGD